jgi:hypothetical protein
MLEAQDEAPVSGTKRAGGTALLRFAAAMSSSSDLAIVDRHITWPPLCIRPKVASVLASGPMGDRTTGSRTRDRMQPALFQSGGETSLSVAQLLRASEMLAVRWSVAEMREAPHD